MKRASVWFFFTVLCGLTVTGCKKEQTEPDAASGKEIVFQAATSYRNGNPTRTEYSGDLVEERAYERIDWVAGEDRIRVLSKQAAEGPVQDYRVVSPSSEGRYSKASVQPVKSKLYWGTGRHTFFGLYPAPGMESAIGGKVSEDQVSVSLNEAGTEASVRGVILPEQKGKWEGRIFKPDMNYAYMGAATTASEGEKVELSFLPLVTTLEFNLHAADDGIAAATLVSLSLKSSSTKLTGTFTTSLKADNTHTEPVLSDTGDQVTIPLGDGMKLSTDKAQPVRITVLTLPVDQTDLVATLHFRRDDGTGFDRSLPLRTKDGGAITVHACKKVYIWNLGVPEDVIVYEFDVVADLEGFPAIGGGSKVKYYTITSYKQKPGEEKQPVRWSATFETEDGSKPAWLNRFTTSNASYLTSDPMKMAATVYVNEADKSDTPWPQEGVNRTEESAIDLSLKDGIHDSGSARRTANCYVVSAPGWYKFPAVYGNALDEAAGGDNQKAYHYVDADGAVRDELDGAPFRPFVNALGNPISKPWILSDTGKALSGVEAVLCWQDRKDLTSGWTVKEDNGDPYVYFYVSPETLSYGNAVLALKEKGGDILWSWHIWASYDRHVGTKTLKAQDLPGTVVTSNQLLNAPLGWCEPETFRAQPRDVWVTVTQEETGKTARFRISQKDTTAQSYGNHPYYQWGRKDPMLPASGEIQNNKNKSQYGDYLWKIEQPAVRLEQAIRNPNVFYGSTVKGSWFIQDDYLDTHHSFWDSGMGKAHNLDRPVVKTVYDPSPVGFHVPNSHAFTAFSKAEDEDGHTGLEYFNSPEGQILTEGDFYYYYSFYCTPEGGDIVTIPALGYREKGALKNVSMKAYAWTASTKHDTAHDGSRLYISYKDKQVHPLSDWYIKYGFAIYPVAD